VSQNYTGVNPLLLVRHKALFASASEALVKLGATDLSRPSLRINALDGVELLVVDLLFQISAEANVAEVDELLIPGLRHDALIADAHRIQVLVDHLRASDDENWPAAAAHLYALIAKLLGRLALHQVEEQQKASSLGESTAAWVETEVTAGLIWPLLQGAGSRILESIGRNCTARELTQVMQALERHATYDEFKSAMDVLRQHSPAERWQLAIDSRPAFGQTHPQRLL